MTSEHDRLLAEGPRTAPEPLTAPDLEAPAAPQAAPFFDTAADATAPDLDAPAAPQAAPFFDNAADATPAPAAFDPPAPREPGARRSGPLVGSPRGSRRSLARLLVPAVVAGVLVARAAFDGHGGGSAAFLIVWLAVLALGIGLRRRRL
jgi:hypothetical protein